ncbi:MAG TPA: DUF1559 domain-containing protein [Gemmataceae bacterium]|nr:DUF1559 domain-containing protein [Gemmataceae bacterium]
MRPASPRRAFTLVELIVVLAIIGILAGLLLAAVMQVRAAASRTACSNNLRQIGLALHAYHGAYAHLPPGVSYHGGADPYSFMSWNTRLLPFLEQDAQWKQAQQAFAEQHWFMAEPPHLGLGTVMPIYSCPADPRSDQPQTFPYNDLQVAFTWYLGVEGINQDQKDGVLYLDSEVRLTDIADGTSNTLLVGERPPSADGVLGWWYAGEGQSHDGSADMVLGVNEHNAFTYAGNCPFGPYQFGPGRSENQCDALHFWSLHAGHGANFAFADASVHFIPYSAAPLMPALATRSGREVVAPPD